MRRKVDHENHIFNQKGKATYYSKYVEQTTKVSGNLMRAKSNARAAKVDLRAILFYLPLINYSRMDNSNLHKFVDNVT